MKLQRLAVLDQRKFSGTAGVLCAHPPRDSLDVLVRAAS